MKPNRPAHPRCQHVLYRCYGPVFGRDRKNLGMAVLRALRLVADEEFRQHRFRHGSTHLVRGRPRVRILPLFIIAVLVQKAFGALGIAAWSDVMTALPFQKG